MTNVEKTYSHRQSYPASHAGLPSARRLRTFAALVLLLAYAIGFVILYPVARQTVSKSAAEGNDPTILEFVGP